MKSVAVAALVAAVLVGAAAALSLEKVHLVEYNTDSGNYLFRGDMPCNDTAFAIDDLRAFLAQRAAEAGAPALPADYYLTDLSLNNPFDFNKFEAAFWADGAHADVGQLVNWPLGLAGVFPPSFYNESKAAEMALGPVWWFDQMPTRMQTVRQMVTTKAARPQVIYVHCTAGCDRTGQFVGSYRMQFAAANVTAMYADDTAECGRSPNWYGTGGLEWYCLYYSESTGQNIGDCSGFAKCDLFGKCKPADADALDAAEGEGADEAVDPKVGLLTRPQMCAQLMERDGAVGDDVVSGLPALPAPASVLPLVTDDDAATPATHLDALDRLYAVTAAIRDAQAVGDAAYLP